MSNKDGFFDNKDDPVHTILIISDPIVIAITKIHAG